MIFPFEKGNQLIRTRVSEEGFTKSEKALLEETLCESDYLSFRFIEMNNVFYSIGNDLINNQHDTLMDDDHMFHVGREIVDIALSMDGVQDMDYKYLNEHLSILGIPKVSKNPHNDASISVIQDKVKLDYDEVIVGWTTASTLMIGIIDL